MKTEAEISAWIARLETPVRPSDLQAATGLTAKEVHAALAELCRRRMALPLKAGSRGDALWISADALIARDCPWTPEMVLHELRQQPLKQWQLCALSGANKIAMSLVLRRMAENGQAKQIAKKGGRFWAAPEYRVKARGEASKLKPVRLDRLVRYVEKNQPVKLEAIAEHFGRGFFYIRSRMGKLLDKGKVKHSVVGRSSYRYVMPDWAPTVDDLHEQILLRMEEVEGGCTRWEGAHNKQKHPLVRHDRKPKRVDIVLWTVVHGKKIKPGHTLVSKCGNPWCCTHEHHKQVTRGEAMAQSMRAIGFGGPKHGAAVAAAVRKQPGRFTPEQLAFIKTAPLTDSTVAALLCKSKSTIASARSGRTYKDYGHLVRCAATPFTGLGAR